MKPDHSRIADLWCRLMHAEPMWPAHGQYECRKCGCRYPVSWQEPSPAGTRHRLERPYILPEAEVAVGLLRNESN